VLRGGYSCGLLSISADPVDAPAVISRSRRVGRWFFGLWDIIHIVNLCTHTNWKVVLPEGLFIILQGVCGFSRSVKGSGGLCYVGYGHILIQCLKNFQSYLKNYLSCRRPSRYEAGASAV
jgi:hypothetical protein